MTLDPQSLQGLATFRYAMRRFLAASEAISQAAGVTPQQYQALLAIRVWPEPSMMVKDLAEQLLLTHHAAVQLVNRLEAAGFARRARCDQDRRSVSLDLTTEGEALVQGLAAEHLKAMQSQEPLLSKSLRRLRAMAPAGDAGDGGKRDHAVA